jgi:Fe-S-cluster-containing dehydrogenase component
VHDLETCVGCHACVIACANENDLHDGRLWRQIVTYNPARHPASATHHLSLACNHCLAAPCLHHCPAAAITRDTHTGVVLIDDATCIGCRYCSWVCPFDAPRFDTARGVMTKCTLCNHRLHAGTAPACTGLCPTGALQFDGRDTGAGGDLVPAGFPRTTVSPAIRFLPLRRHGLVAGGTITRSPIPLVPVVPAPPRKVTLRSEWSLAAFTFTAIVLAAWLLAWAFGGPHPNAWVVAGLGAGGMMVSAAHLGRPGRAWRAALNWRRSWLSREVLAYGGFMGLATIAVALDAPPWARWLSAAAGLACLACVDQVYAVMAREDATGWDRAAATTSGVFLAGVAAGVPAIAVPAGLLRLAGFLARARAQSPARNRELWWLAAARAGAGVACLLSLAGSDAGMGAALPLALLGEALDRCDFYQRLDIVTPAGTAARDLRAALGHAVTS